MKGFHIILKTAKELFRNNKDIFFIIAGGFYPDKDALHKKWKEDSPPNMKYLGFLLHNDLAKYYASADVAIVPSIWEDPCPLVVLESMSSETSVIGSRIGGIPELIDDSINGFLIKPGSVEELKDKILWCKNQPSQLKEMGIKARGKALKFDWAIVSERLKNIYLEVITGKK